MIPVPGTSLLTLTLSILIVANVSAGELSQNARAKIPEQVLTEFLQSGEGDLIFLFDDSHIARQARLKTKNRQLQFEDTIILQTKKRAYEDIKNSVLLGFSNAEIKQVYRYQSLPMLFASVETPEALYKILENKRVVQVFKNEVHTLSLKESLPLIGQPQSYAAGHGGQGTTVAVLDTGVDYKRAAFGSCSQPGVPDECKVIFARDFTLRDDGELDMHGHGTNVAGIVVGVAPDTRIAALDVFTDRGIHTADAIAAIDWVISNQATYNIVAMNLSFGIGLFDQLCDESWATTPFANARAAGVVPIVASGNDSEVAKVKNPACAPGAVRVGAVYDAPPDGRGYRTCASELIDADVVPCFSNSAPFLDFLAPGISITAAGLTKSGTSMATPHVTGAYAVLKGLSAYPGSSIESTIERLKHSGQPVLDDRNGIIFPRIDLESALFELLPDQVPDISYFEPVHAPEGQIMQVHGTGFRGVNAVTIGGTPAFDFTVESSQLIRVDIGSGSSGDVRVSTSLGSDGLGGFTYIDSVRESEPNNSFEDANWVMLSEKRIVGGLSDQDDADVFRFGLDPGTVSFGIKPLRPVCCSRLIQAEIQDREGRVLASGRIEESVGELVNLQATITSRDRYHLVISETPEGDPVFDHDYQIKVPEHNFNNANPQITSTPPGAVLMGQNYEYSLKATDSDGDAVHRSILAAPEGMGLNAQTGTLSWRPDARQAGVNKVELLVSDDFAGYDKQSFNIVVIDSSAIHINATDGTFTDFVRLSFNPLEGTSSYRVFRCPDLGETCGSPVGFTKRDFFNDMKAVPGQLYYYRVRACTTSACSPLSQADAGFSGITPPRPTMVRATDGLFSDHVMVTFKQVNGASLYRIFRCNDSGSTCGAPIAYPRNTRFDDRSGEPGRIYHYRVKACNSQHCGKFSVANAGHTSIDSDNDGMAHANVKTIPVLNNIGRCLFFHLILIVVFVTRYRAHQPGKLNWN